MGEFGSLTWVARCSPRSHQAINIKFLKRFPAYCDFIGKAAPMHDEAGFRRDSASRRAQNPARTKEQSRNKFPIS